CTDGWLEAGPVERHRQPEALAAMAQELAGAGLEEMTARLRDDAVARSGGTLRDDLVLLAARPAAGGGEAEDELERAVA
ncbi:MAG TPA: SpoIIE family protein phosphatase, partial [Solirubrobacterales bacterium]|nr:SpoIIE family protein phosphatase [Solirubrobacterales bacterium]